MTGQEPGGGPPSGYRRLVVYRLSVWFLRLAAVALPCSFIWPQVWFVLPIVIVFGLIVTLPLRYLAHFEWRMPMLDLDASVLKDALDIRYW
ncbi:hypothetical protein O7608_27050 [Solwaraspora sp. WMMA2056]|uniref:hypothetical protein n=1 Tax=Solwaraspora sp. WMMA2056 TaxID=3015161 RepID=UPI00259B78A2|nr:hypothetical protein [Solwaraspora sp. WMMA2056]WJK40043.1 hypothetical protein O7608_27050 [Solwaraspora sp. WMMA2056]